MTEVVPLTIGDVNTAWELAQGRNQKEKLYGAMTYSPERNTGIEPHMLGMVGELAVARYLNLTVDSRIFSRKGDAGTDLETAGKGTIQVKTTRYEKDPWLRVEKHLPKCDYYVLAACQAITRDLNPKAVSVRLMGYATWEMVSHAPQKKLRSNGPMNYVLTHGELLPLRGLKAILDNEELP